MTSPVSVLRVRGLHTGRSLLTAPEGALQVADDVVLSQPDTVEPRRGQYAVGSYEPGDLDGLDESGLVAGGRILAWSLDSGGAGRVSGGDPGLMVPLLGDYGSGSMGPPVLRHIPGLGMLLLLADGTRLARPDVILTNGDALQHPGVDRALDPTLTLTGTSGFLPTGSSVAYRATYGRYVQGRWTEGAPSGRVVITNASGGSRNVSLFLSVPPTLSLEPGGFDFTGLVVRVYRSDAVTTGVPLDEVFLAYEGEVGGDSVIVIDTAPPEFLGAPLYSNAETGDGFGLAGANDMPPQCAGDVCSWNGRTWWSTWKDTDPAFIAMLGVGAPSGLQSGDTITIGALTLRAQTTPSLTADFQLTSTGNPAADVRATVAAMLARLNALSDEVYGWAASSEDDFPGRVELRLRRSSFGVNLFASRPTAWSLGAAFVGATTSAGQLRYSKLSQPESVPRSFSFDVGARDAPIIALAPLRERLLVAKTDGLYLVSGDGPFSVQLLDASVRMAFQARTVAVLSGEAYLLASDDRVYAVTEGGARDVSAPVQDLLADASRNLAATAAADDIEGRYVLHLGPDSDALVWNAHARGWTRWRLPRDWVAYDQALSSVAANGQGGTTAIPTLYSGGSGTLYAERNTGAVTDYADGTEALTVTAGAVSSDGTQALTRTGGAVPVPGDVVHGLDEGGHGTVVSVNGNALVVHLGSGENIQPGEPVELLRSYDCEARFTPWHGGAPASLKKLSNVTMHFARYGLWAIGTSPRVTALADGQDAGAEGLSLPGEQDVSSAEESGAWSALVQPRNVRVQVPQEQQARSMVSPGLRVRQARGFWRLAGYTLEAAVGGTRNSR